MTFSGRTKYPLCILGAKIKWSEFDKSIGPLYSEDKGRPAKPTRLIVGFHYLKHTYNLSDEEVVSQWLENPYWQYFCGNEYFEHGFPIDASSMTRWRKRVSESGMEKLLEEAINMDLRADLYTLLNHTYFSLLAIPYILLNHSYRQQIKSHNFKICSSISLNIESILISLFISSCKRISLNFNPAIFKYPETC